MSRSTIRNTLFGVCAAASVLLSAAAIAQEHMSAKARFCADFRINVIMHGKIDEASKYATDDFKEHNLQLQADGLQAFIAKYKQTRATAAARPRPQGGTRSAGPIPRWALSAGDLVVFITPIPAGPDPANPGRTLPATTHFDVWQLRDGKIAEHWD